MVPVLAQKRSRDEKYKNRDYERVIKQFLWSRFLYFSSRLLFCARTGTIKIAILLARSYQNYFVSMEAKYIDMELRIGDRDPCSLFKNKLYFILFYLITLEGSSGHDI